MQSIIESIKTTDIEKLEDDDKELISSFYNILLDTVPIEFISILTLEEIYGEEEINKEDGVNFFSTELNRDNPMQLEVIARVSEILQLNGLTEADKYVIQGFKRTAGLSNKTIDYNNKYCTAVCLRDYQLIRYNGKDYFIKSDEINITPVFKLDDNIVGPKIKSNKILKINNEKNMLKALDYFSIIVWAYWKDKPIKPE